MIVLQLAIQCVFYSLAFSGPALVFGHMAGLHPALTSGCLVLLSALGVVRAMFLGERRGVFGLLGVAASAGLTIWLAGFTLPALGFFVTLAVLQIVCLRHVYGRYNRLLDNRVTATGLVFFPICYVLCFFTKLSPLCPLLGWYCLVFILVLLVMLNRMSTKEVSGGQVRRMLGGNQIVTLVVAGLLAVLVFMAQIREAVGNFFLWLLGLILGGGGQPEFTATEQTGGGLGQPDLAGLLGEMKERPPWLDFLLMALAYVLATIGLLFLLGVLGFLMYKALRGAVKKLNDWLRSFRMENTEEFTETTEQLLSLESMGRQWVQDAGKRLRKLFVRPPAWERLTPAQRIRRLYETTLRTLAPYTPTAPCMTPEQLVQTAGRGQTPFATLYNQVRYAEGDVTKEQAEEARAYMKGAK